MTTNFYIQFTKLINETNNFKTHISNLIFSFVHCIYDYVRTSGLDVHTTRVMGREFLILVLDYAIIIGERGVTRFNIFGLDVVHGGPITASSVRGGTLPFHLPHDLFLVPL